MRIEVNGEPRDVGSDITLADLIKDLALTPERVAIELNRTVVRRSEWPAIAIAEGDRIEIVHFVGGGSGSPRARSRSRSRVPSTSPRSGRSYS